MRAALVAMALAMFAATPAAAHEIPRSVLIKAFVRPDARTLRMLVRVPLEAMRDVEFPLRGDGMLDLARSDSVLRYAARLWIADQAAMYENGTALSTYRLQAVRVSLPSDRSFADYAHALGHMREPPLANSLDLPWRQAMLDVLLEYDIASPQSRFAVQTSWVRLGVQTTTVLDVADASGATRVLTFDGDPGLVRLDPRWDEAGTYFVRLGLSHILTGIDHLLFLFCLVIPVRRLRPLIAIVTAFTVAHSVTLIASALGFAPTALWFPPLIEVLIALSIVYMACENILGVGIERRWMLAFGFGLVHGFGFSFALRETLQFAGGHLAIALATFNVGVELGQLAVLTLMLPVLIFLFARVRERPLAILMSAFVAHTAWHWMTERFTTLRAYRFTPPAFDALFAADMMRFLLLLLIIGALAWVLSVLVARLGASRRIGTAAGIIAMALVAAAGARDLHAQPPRTTMAGVYTTKQAEQGREVFTSNCLGCHTTTTHTGSAFATRWVGLPLSDLFDYISSQMPKSAPGSLTEDEYLWVTAYLLKLNSMPAGPTALTADEKTLKTIRIDTLPAVRK